MRSTLSALFRRLAATLLATFAAGAVQAASAPPLPALGADPAQTTVSGLSSGAFMASQFSVAYSASIAGAGIVADSVAALELEETRAKARGLLRALDGAA